MSRMVEIAGLTKTFGAFTAVDNISFVVERGEVLGFLGPNGAGKTTAMRMITGFLPPTSGSVAVCGFDVAHEPIEVKRRVGYLPEGAPLYDDMTPLRRPRRRTTARQIAVAHGHYEPVPNRRTDLRPSWLIGDREIAATGADYVALGHWNLAKRVGNGTVPAYYSGSPELAGTVNVVRLDGTGEVRVERRKLR